MPAGQNTVSMEVRTTPPQPRRRVPAWALMVMEESGAVARSSRRTRSGSWPGDSTIADALALARRREARELSGGRGDDCDEDSDLVNAEDRDPLAALELVDGAVQEGLDLAAPRAAGALIWKTAEAGKLIWQNSGPDEEPRPEADVFTPLASMIAALRASIELVNAGRGPP
jgi:hypothetical protein